jgi:SAM-dependent methyltransferase
VDARPGGFVDAFSDTAERYARSRPEYPDALFRELAALAPGRRCAWDCGTGNGQAAVGLARHFEQVEAGDPSAEQIAHALPDPRVRYRVATAEHSGLAPGSVDAISVAQALHWFDLDRFHAEVRRVARPGAVIAVYGYSWFYISPDIDELVDRWLLRPVDAWWPAHNRLLWDGYSTIAFPYSEIRPPRLALHLGWTLEQLLDYYLSWSAPRRRMAREGDGFVAEARAALAAAWGGPERARHVVMPLGIRIGRLA